MLCQFLNHFNICILTIILSTVSLAIILFFSVAYLLECGRKTPKCIGGLALVCMLLYLILVQLLEYMYIYILTCLAARNMNIFFKIRGDYIPGILAAGEKKLPHTCIYRQNAQYVRFCLHASYNPSSFGA